MSAHMQSSECFHRLQVHFFALRLECTSVHFVTSQLFSAISSMTHTKKDQRIQIKFMVAEGLSQEVIHHVQAVNGNNSLCRSSIQNWYNRFRNGDPLNDDCPKSGAPKKRTAAKIQQINNIIQQDRRSSLRELARQSGQSYGATRKVVKEDLSLKKKPAKWIPHFLTNAQKNRHVYHARAALQMFRCQQNRPESIICEDESWIHVWNPGSKESTHEWISANEPCPAKPVIECTTLKTMLVVFFDKDGMIHREFVPDGHGIGGVKYFEILSRFQRLLHCQRPVLFRSGRWALLHDGAHAHIARMVKDFI